MAWLALDNAGRTTGSGEETFDWLVEGRWGDSPRILADGRRRDLSHERCESGSTVPGVANDGASCSRASAACITTSSSNLTTCMLSAELATACVRKFKIWPH